jgi:hypothetical protein
LDLPFLSKKNAHKKKSVAVFPLLSLNKSQGEKKKGITCKNITIFFFNTKNCFVGKREKQTKYLFFWGLGEFCCF